MKPRNTPFYFLCICFLLIAASELANAQNLNSNARSVGMANTGVSTVNGVDAIGINPAGILLDQGKHLSIGLLPFGMFAGTDFLDMTTYKKYFTGVDDGTGKRTAYYLNDADKQTILSMFKGDLGHFSSNIGFNLIGVTVTTHFGSLGLNISDRIAANLTIPSDYADFLLYGNTPGKTFNFDKTQINSWWIRDYSLTYARNLYLPIIKNLSVGVSGKYVQGFGYFGTESFNSHFTTAPDSFVITGQANLLAHYAGTEFLAQMQGPMSFELFPSPVGQGFGIDIGAIAEFYNGITVGISLIDIGAITWNRNAKEISANEEIHLSDFSDGTQLKTLQEKLNGREQIISSFSTALPTTLNVGASMKFTRVLGRSDQAVLAASLRQGFNNMPGTSTSPRIGFGGEWDFIGGIPLRTGVAFGGYSPVALAAGIGLNIEKFRLDLSTDNLGVAFNQNSSAASFAIGMRVDF